MIDRGVDEIVMNGIIVLVRTDAKDVDRYPLSNKNLF